MCAQIISRIKSGKVHSQEVVDVLISRLQQKRPRKVFGECPRILDQQQKGQLLGEVSNISMKPMDRFSKDLRSGQQAKVLAYEILGNMQGAAHSPRPRGAEDAAADTAHHEQPVEVMEARRTPSTAPEQQQQSDSQNLLPGFDSHESGPQARAGYPPAGPNVPPHSTDQSVLKQMGWL
ncbi:hypothetical protein WJX75_001999 [Coccomyxa subellipsoidea]|uniref:Uncharacterized protein n=1 Tax=Coccomyxa subellipsoidea TaxID=248742 RepID=A0ABR2YQ40_9CHLO